MPIKLPVSAPGADVAEKSLAGVRNEVDHLQKSVDNAAPAVESFGKRMGNAARNFNEVTTAASRLGNGIVAAGKFLSDGSAAIESHERALNSLHGAYTAVAQATNGAVTAEEAARVQAQITTAGLHVTEDQLAAVTKSAREMAIATGVDTSQALDQLTQALISGEKDGLRKFNVSIGEAKDKNEAFTNGVADLTKKMDAVPTSAQTAAEQIKSLNDIWGLFVATIGDSIAKMVGFKNATEMVKDGITGLKYLIGGDKQLGESVASDIQQTGALGRRIAVGQRAKDAGINLHGIALAQGADAINEQSEQIERIMTLRAQAVAAALHGQRAQFEALQAESELSTRKLRGENIGPQYDVPGIQTAERGPGYKTLAEMLNEGGVYNSIAAGPKKKSGGAGGGDKSLDPSTLFEMMQELSMIRRGTRFNLEKGFSQGSGEASEQYLIRVADRLEGVFVDANVRAIKHRDESEIAFAKRRLDLAKSAAEQMNAQEDRYLEGVEKKRQELADKGEAAFNELYNRTKQHQDALVAIQQSGGSGSTREQLAGDLEDGRIKVDDLRARLNAIKDEVLNADVANDDGKVQSLLKEASAVGEVTRAYEDNARAQRKRADVGKVVTDETKKAIGADKTYAENLGGLVSGAINKTAAAMSQHFQALIEGKETFAEAARSTVHEVTMSLAAEALPKALMATGTGLALTAAMDYPGAAAAFASAGTFAAVAALGGLAAAATNAPTTAPAAQAATQGAGGGRVPTAGGNASNDSASGPTIINYNGTVFETHAELEQALTRVLSGAARAGRLDRATAHAIMRAA